MPILGELDGTADSNKRESTRKVDVRLPGEGNSNSHGAWLVHQSISMIKWIRTIQSSLKNSLSLLLSWTQNPRPVILNEPRVVTCPNATGGGVKDSGFRVQSMWSGFRV